MREIQLRDAKANVSAQRIARIHCMGQARPMQIVNFVSKGSIEEGMLSVLAFKRSLSAGILDGGSGEISLGGSRLTRFMKDVENVTGKMGQGEPVTAAEEAHSASADLNGSGQATEDDVDVGAAGNGGDIQDASEGADPWQAPMQVGSQFIAALAAAKNLTPHRILGFGMIRSAAAQA